MIEGNNGGEIAQAPACIVYIGIAAILPAVTAVDSDGHMKMGALLIDLRGCRWRLRWLCR